MEYAALTFWLSVIVFVALGVHRLWTGLVPPKVVNSVLLPGTLVATLGHILGLLITGGTVESTTLIKDDESGEPQTTQNPKPKVPIIGAVIVALLPLAGCAVAIVAVSRTLGSPVIHALTGDEVSPLLLPMSWPLFFETLRQAVTLVERLVEVVRASNLSDGWTLLFLYLAVCLTVRMAPLTGNVRGAIGAILVAGAAAYAVGTIRPPSAETLVSTWSLVTFCVAVLLLLLLASLLVTGAVHLLKSLINSK